MPRLARGRVRNTETARDKPWKNMSLDRWIDDEWI